MGETEPIETPETPPKAERHMSRRRGAKRKSNITFAAFALWIVFLMYWLFFQAGTGYDTWQNITVAMASFLAIGALVGMIWSPKKWRIRFSIIMGIGWIDFVLIWLSFYAPTYSPYRNLAVLLLSLLVFTTIMPGVWISETPGGIRRPKDLRNVVPGAAFIGWLLFSIYWLWFQADSGYTFEQNATVGLFSFLIVYVVGFGAHAKEIGGEEGGYLGLGLGFVWLLFLTIWYHMFAVNFDLYQNIAVVLGSFLLVLGAVGLFVRNRLTEVDRIDFDD